MPSFEIEDLHANEMVCGVDEAGMGPWAGPLVVAACAFLRRNLPFLDNINDSKKLTHKKRENVFRLINDHPDAISCAVAVINAATIDTVGLAKAWLHGVLEVTSQLKPAVCLIDGARAVQLQGARCLSIVKGDQKSYSIAAASIIAKVTRDKMMMQIHESYPEYGFDHHVGYGTAKHARMLAKLGPCAEHRKSFAPVKAALDNHFSG